MRLLLKSARCVVIGLMATTVLLATDHNFDIGPAGTDGVPSAWDSDSIDIPGGNVHLDIPLFQVSENERFGFPLVLRYDSKVWDAADSNFPNSPGSRNVIAKSIVGLGWKIHFGRVFSVSYTNPTNGTTETFYYFQGADGAMHRILLKQNIVGGSCVADAYWYAYDGSGIRAQTNASGWVVWTPDGTRYDLTRLVTGDPTITTPEQVNFKGWYVTTMTGLTPAGVSPDKQPKLTFAYAAPSESQAHS